MVSLAWFRKCIFYVEHNKLMNNNKITLLSPEALGQIMRIKRVELQHNPLAEETKEELRKLKIRF